MRRPICLFGLAYLLLWLALGTVRGQGASFDELEGERLCLIGKVDQKAQSENGWRICLKSVRPVTDKRSNQERAAEEDGKEKQGQKQCTISCRGVLCYMAQDAFADQSVPEIGSYVTVEGICRPFSRAANDGQFDQLSYEQILNLDVSMTNSKIINRTHTYSRLREALWQLKQKWKRAYEEACDEEEASFLTAIVLGDTSEMDSGLKNLFRQNGLSHILAVSGLHVSLIGMGFYRFLRRMNFPVYVRIGGSLSLILLYGMMIGAGVSTRRAMLMFGIYLAAGAFGRTYDMGTALAAAACVLVTGKPEVLRYAGFLFSFGAILAIWLVYPVFTQAAGIDIGHWRGGLPVYRRVWLGFLDSLMLSMSISVVLLPIQLYFYYEVQTYAVLLNLVVLPLFSVFLYLGIAGGVLAMKSVRAGSLLLVPCRWLFGFYRLVLSLAGRLPGSRYICGRPQVWQIAVYYALLLATITWAHRHGRAYAGGGMRADTGGRRGRRSIRGLIFLLLMQSAVLLVCMHFRRDTQITFLDVGQGDCCVLLPKGGSTFLIDAGSSDDDSCAERRLLPFLKANGVRCVDYAFVSHPDADHINAVIDCMESAQESGVRIKNLALSAYAISDERYQKLIEAADASGCRIDMLAPGDQLKAQERNGGQLVVRCLFPYGTEGFADTNDQSLVLEVETCSFRLLFTGDMAQEEERAVLSDMKSHPEHWTSAENVDILKVAHHGSRYSTCEELLEWLSPRIAVISCGKNNRYGHPHGETLERLAQSGCRVFQTMEEGAVTVTLREDAKGNGHAEISGYLTGR